MLSCRRPQPIPSVSWPRSAAAPVDLVEAVVGRIGDAALRAGERLPVSGGGGSMRVSAAPDVVGGRLSFAPTLRRRGPYLRSRKAPGFRCGYRKRLGRTPPVPSRAGANVDRSRHSWSAAARARPALIRRAGPGAPGAATSPGHPGAGRSSPTTRSCRPRPAARSRHGPPSGRPGTSRPASHRTARCAPGERGRSPAARAGRRRPGGPARPGHRA